MTRDLSNDAPSLVKRLWRLNQKHRLYTPRIKEFCFIIGAMKSGTTTLYAYLAQHPTMCENLLSKEPEFFSTPEAPTDLGGYYRQWLPSPLRRRIALEASTGYAKAPALPNVAERIARLPQRKHLIYIVRHPIDRIESHIAHNLARGQISRDAALTIETLRHQILVSEYDKQLALYRAAMPNTPIHIVDFQRICETPLSAMTALCQKLGISANFRFTPLPAQNTRADLADAADFHLNAELREALWRRLAPNMAAFSREFEFDVSRWGF